MSLIAGESFFEKDAVRAALRSAFRAFDENGSGMLEGKEFEAAIVSIVGSVEGMDMDAIVSELDADKSGEVSIVEFLEKMQRPRPAGVELGPELKALQGKILKQLDDAVAEKVRVERERLEAEAEAVRLAAEQAAAAALAAKEKAAAKKEQKRRARARMVVKAKMAAKAAAGNTFTIPAEQREAWFREHGQGADMVAEGIDESQIPYWGPSTAEGINMLQQGDTAFLAGNLMLAKKWFSEGSHHEPRSHRFQDRMRMLNDERTRLAEYDVLFPTLAEQTR